MTNPFDEIISRLAKKKGWSEVELIAVTELLFKLAKIDLEIRKEKSMEKIIKVGKELKKVA